MSELKRHKTSDAIKWICVTLAVLVLAVGVTAAMTKGFTDWNPYGWLDKKTETPAPDEDPDGKKESDPNDNLIITPEEKTSGVKLAAARTTDSGIDAQSDAGYIITATVLDQYGGECDATLTATVEWSKTASGNVADYVTAVSMEPSDSDSHARWRIECKQPFGTQIIFKVALASDPSNCATATVDYKERIASITAFYDTNRIVLADGGVMTFTVPPRSSFTSFLDEDHNINFFSAATKTVGTISATYTKPTSITVQGAPSFNTTLSKPMFNVTQYAVNAGSDDLAPADFFTNLHNLDSSNMAMYFTLHGDLQKSSNQYIVTLTFSGQTTFHYYINVEVAASIPQSVDLSSSNVVF